jgi:hypothetical protein
LGPSIAFKKSQIVLVTELEKNRRPPMTQFFKNLSALAFLMTLLSGCGQTPAARRSYIQPSTTMNYFDTSSTSSTAAPVVNTTLRCTLKVNDSLTSPVPVAPGSSTRFEVAAQGGSLLDYNFKRIVINGSQLTNFALRNTTRANNIATLDYTFSNSAILGDIPVTAYIRDCQGSAHCDFTVWKSFNNSSRKN